MAAPFDHDRLELTGPAQTLGDRVAMALGGVAYLSVGRDLLVYQRTTTSNLARIDRTGTRTLLTDRAAIYHKPTLSPDGRALALDIEGDRAGDRDVWVYDFGTTTLSRLTSLGDGHDPAWTPDGRSLTVLRNSTASGVLMMLPVDRSGAPRPFPIASSFDQRDVITPGNWLPDGRAYLVGTSVPETQSDIWLLYADGSAPVPLAITRADEHSPVASPDGRWFAFVSSESGRQEVYVQGLATQGARSQISRAGGTSPVWARDGRAIYYLEPAGPVVNLIEASLAAGPAPRVVARQQVIPSLSLAQAVNHPNFDVAPDGRSFFALVPEANQGLVVVTGWRAQLTKGER
jgi:serine/threonine-protein kinase